MRPPLVGGIADGKGLLSLGVAGVRQRGLPDQVTLTDRWHLGSETKAMTATLVATFVEDGEMSFDRTIPELFPEVKAHNLWKAATMRDLLQHTAGVGDISTPTWHAWWTGGDVETLRANYVREVLEAPPNEAISYFYYSNGGYVLAGAALEAAHRQNPGEQLMEERLFQPLGMDECGFGAPDTADHPSGHDRKGTPTPGFDNPPALGPAGTVHCTMQSWARFAAANVAGPGGGAPILEAGTWQELHHAKVGDYALGWGVTKRPWAGGTVVQHIGSNTTWYAWIWVAPLVDRAYFAVTNSGNDDHLLTVDRAIGSLIQSDRYP